MIVLESVRGSTGIKLLRQATALRPQRHPQPMQVPRTCSYISLNNSLIHRLRTRPWSTSCLSYASSIQMTSKLMRKLQSSAHCPAASWTSRHDLRVRVFCRHKSSAAGSHPLRQVPPRRYLAQVRPEPISEVWFTAASPRFGPADELLDSPPGNNADHQPPNERLLKLGKSKCRTSTSQRVHKE